MIDLRSIQDLADLVRVDGVGGAGSADSGGAQTTEAGHVAAARGLSLALAALTGLLRHLELLGDSSNHGTFSLTLGERVRQHGCYSRRTNITK